MGLLYLLTAMTVVVATALYTIINRVYRPKQTPALPPPKERKRKNGKKGRTGGGKGYKIKFKSIQLDPDENVLEQDVEELEDEMKDQTGTTGQPTLTPNGESINGTTAVNTPKKASSTPNGELDRVSPAAKLDTKSSSILNGGLENHMTIAKAIEQPAATSIDEYAAQAPVTKSSTQSTTSAPEEPAKIASNQPASTSPGKSQYHTPEIETPTQALSTPSKQSRKKKARHPPPAPPSESSGTRASDIIETPTYPANPTPAPEFTPLFSLVEPDNLDQLTRLSHSLSRLTNQMTTNLRINPGQTRTSTLITLLWNLHFASSPSRALPTSGSPRDRHLEARDIACQFLNRYGALFWPPEPQPAPHLRDRELQWPRDSHLTAETAAQYESLGVSVPKKGTALDLALSEMGVRMAGLVEMVFELPVEVRAGVDWRAVGLILDDRGVDGVGSLGGREAMLGLELRREVRGGDGVVLREIEELSPGF